MRATTLLTRLTAALAVGVLTASGAVAGARVADPATAQPAGHAAGSAGAEVVQAAPGPVRPVPTPAPSGVAPTGQDQPSAAGSDDRAEKRTEQARERQEREQRRERERREREQRRVRALQRRLAELGWYGGAIDGIAGPGTEQAIRGFQRAAGLAADGVVGPRTREALADDGAVTRRQWEASRPDPEPASTTGGDAGGGTSSSGSTGSSSGSCDLDCRGQRILDRNPLPVPSGWTVTFEPGRDGYLGMAYGPPRREVVIWVRDSHSDQKVGATLLHELGHAYDFTGLGGHGDDGRRRWAELRDFEWQGHDAWFGNGCGSCTDYSVGAGDLAESVHACWAPGWDSFRSQLAGPPTAHQCDVLRDLLR